MCVCVIHLCFFPIGTYNCPASLTCLRTPLVFGFIHLYTQIDIVDHSKLSVKEEHFVEEDVSDRVGT